MCVGGATTVGGVHMHNVVKLYVRWRRARDTSGFIEIDGRRSTRPPTRARAPPDPTNA